MDVVRVEGDPAVAEVAVVRFRGDDRLLAEVVDGLAPPIPRERKWIANVSTQFGCPVGCPFCDAGGEFHGNLAAGEMLDQVRWVLDRHPEDPGRCAKLKVHFARMGEPALNDAVLDAVAALPEATGAPGLWCCVPTVAPRGRNRWFDRLIDEKEARHRGRFQLQFSVQSTRASDRARLIPIPHWSLDEIAAYGVRFVRPGDRKAVLNFALAEDVAFDPAAIRDRFDPAAFAVKITPVNPTARGAASRFRTVLRSDAEARVRGAAEDLVSRGFDVVWSVGDPREDRVGSNCGQAVRVFRFGERPGERPATSAPA